MLDDGLMLKELKALLLRKFPEDFEKVILYGSRAEGTAAEFSDYDILIILKNEYDSQRIPHHV